MSPRKADTDTKLRTVRAVASDSPAGLGPLPSPTALGVPGTTALPHPRLRHSRAGEVPRVWTERGGTSGAPLAVFHVAAEGNAVCPTGWKRAPAARPRLAASPPRSFTSRGYPRGPGGRGEDRQQMLP